MTRFVISRWAPKAVARRSQGRKFECKRCPAAARGIDRHRMADTARAAFECDCWTDDARGSGTTRMLPLCLRFCAMHESLHGPSATSGNVCFAAAFGVWPDMSVLGGYATPRRIVRLARRISRSRRQRRTSYGLLCLCSCHGRRTRLEICVDRSSRA